MSSPPSASSFSVRPRIAPSMLSCDLAKFADESQRMINDGADWLHLDVMDGHFVPNLTFGAPVIQWVRKSTSGFLDCHLMVTQPEKWVDDFAKAGCNQFTFHIEVESDKPALIKKIKSLGMRCGIAIKPKTPIETVFPYVEQHHIDEVLVMTVEPGFGGQSFMSDMMPKVATLRRKYPHLDIEVDGGVAEDTIDVCAAAGANAIVSGTGVFKAKSPRHAIEAMRASVQKQIDENFPQLSKYAPTN